MLKLSLCDHSDTYIFAKVIINVAGVQVDDAARTSVRNDKKSNI